MRKAEISEAIGLIDPKYVDEATAYTGEVKAVRRPVWVKWSVIAACLCLIVAALAVPTMWHANPTQDSVIISEYSSGVSIDSCYITPGHGEYFCFTEVNAARKEYAGQDVFYLLGFDIFGSKGIDLSKEELHAEYQRLADLGYRLYYADDHWTYYGDNQKEYIPIVVGLFTEDELSDFDASEQYGYAFYFVTNGDGSPVSVDEGNVVTNFNSVLY